MKLIVRDHRRRWRSPGITAHMVSGGHWEFRHKVDWGYGRANVIEHRYDHEGKSHWEVRASGKQMGYFRLDLARLEELLPRFVDKVFGWPGLSYPEVCYWHDWKDWPA